MGITGIWQWIIILAIVLILFGGAGKISAIMGDFGKGLRNFKKGIKDDDAIDGEIVDMTDAEAQTAAQPQAQPAPTVTKAKKARVASQAKAKKSTKKKRAKKAKQ